MNVVVLGRNTEYNKIFVIILTNGATNGIIIDATQSNKFDLKGNYTYGIECVLFSSYPFGLRLCGNN